MHPCRVVFLVENTPFHRDKRVQKEAAALRAIGCEVTVIAPMNSAERKHYVCVVDGVRDYGYWQPWNGGGFLGYVFEYGWAIACSIAILCWVWFRYGMDIVHVANPPDLFVPALAPFKVFGKKIVYDQHDLCPELFETKFGNSVLVKKVLLLLERWSYRISDLVIVTNQSTFDIAIRRGSIPVDKAHIVRNGPDLEVWRAGQSCPALKEGMAHLVVYIGSMGDQDGVDLIVKAVHHIVQVRGRQDVRFALLGDGPTRRENERLAVSIGLGANVSFLGWVGDADLLAYTSTADVCLAPDPPHTVNQLSTLIKIMEYMSCGKVTVSFDLLESRRTAGSAAIYVEKDDPAMFGDAILDILDDPLRRERLGQFALERVRTSLHWGLSRDALLRAYHQVLGIDVEKTVNIQSELA